MTGSIENMVRKTQRCMLRQILQRGRRITSAGCGDTQEDSELEDETPDEPERDELLLETWVDWIKRVTESAESLCNKLGLEDWITTQRRFKWRWAGHLVRRQDHRWSLKLLHWVPVWRRSAGHPCARWIDSIELFLGRFQDYNSGDWILHAMNKDEWKKLEDDYASQL